MKANRGFDCVALKDEIQRKLLAARGNLTEAEAMAGTRRRLAASRSPSGQLWRRLRAAEAPALSPLATAR